MNREAKEMRLLSGSSLETNRDTYNSVTDDVKLISGIQRAQNWKPLVSWD